jgi:S-adenosylmethionine:tRNA ribosyltransferase-isomerase
MQALQLQQVHTAYVTLHVGAGTFMPVKSETMQQHNMHTEFIEVHTDAIAQLLAQQEAPVIAVGTTSLRTIESLYWLGVKAKLGMPVQQGLQQWDAYELPVDLSYKNALRALQQWMQQQQTEKLVTRTQLLIAPGYQLRVAAALITNFHQPASTLLLLVAALLGDKWKQVYAHALDNDYRFLSYGDGSLLWGTEA